MVSPLEFSRQRDRRIFDILDAGPVTLKQLVKLGVFPSYQVASRRFVRLAKRSRGRKPRCVDLVATHDAGRLAKLFCSWVPRHALHEYLLSEELIGYPVEFTKWKRGDSTDNELKPDAQLGELCIEFDTGTESRVQVQKQARREYPGKVLWVVQSLSRFDWIKDVANPGNTLVKIAGSNEVYDLNGRVTTLEKLCSATLSLYNTPATRT